MKITASMNDKSQQQQQQEAYFAAAAAAMLPFLNMQQQQQQQSPASTASSSSATAFAQHFLNELSNPNASFLNNLYLQNQSQQQQQQQQQQQMMSQSNALNQLACLNMLNELSKTANTTSNNNTNKASNHQTSVAKSTPKATAQNSNNNHNTKQNQPSVASNQPQRPRQANELNNHKSTNNQHHQPQPSLMNTAKSQKPFPKDANNHHSAQRNTETNHIKQQQVHADSLSSSPSSSLSFSSSGSNSRRKEPSHSSSFSINNLISDSQSSSNKVRKANNSSNHQPAPTSAQQLVKQQSSNSSTSNKPAANFDYLSSLFGATSNGNNSHQVSNSSLNTTAAAVAALSQSSMGNLNKNDLNLLNMLAALNSFGGMTNVNAQTNLNDPATLNYLSLLNSLNPLLLTSQDLLSQPQLVTQANNNSNGKKLKDSSTNATSPYVNNNNNNNNANQAANRTHKVPTQPKDTETNPTQMVNVKNAQQNATNKLNNQLQMTETFEPAQQDKLRKPLKLGWRRETIVKDIGKQNGIHGVVIYTTPCLKRMRNMHDIEQYLKQQAEQQEKKIPSAQLNISNFSFNSNKIVGGYLVPKEPNSTAQTSQGKYNRLNEKQILVILNEHTKLKPKATVDEVTTRKESREHVNGAEKHLPIKAEKLHHHQYQQQQSQQERELLIQQEQQKQFELQLQLKMEQQRQLEQLNEAKRLQHERKTREKWFEFIMLREQQQSAPSINVHLIDENQTATLVNQPFESIDDMQERFGRKMPAFKQLHLESQCDMNWNSEEKSAFCLDWFGDTLQVIEFVKTFGEQISQGIEETSEPNEFNVTFDANQFASILSNVEQFRAGLDNRSEKLRKDFVQIVLLLTKAAINNSTKPKSDTDDDEEDDENEEESEEVNEPNSNNHNHNSSKELANENGHDSSFAQRKETNVPEDDEIYLMNKLNMLECNESTYSELIRLYLKRSLLDLNKRRTTYTFNCDVTQSLHERLTTLSTALEHKSFESVDVAHKANILAYLCDELLQTGYYEISNTAASNTNANGVDVGTSDEAEVGPVTRSIDEAIDELNEIKREKWALESQIRQIKAEKLSAMVVPAELNKSEPIEESEREKALDKQKKIAAQYDKKLAQVEKKREQLKESYENSVNKLRAGIHCGQDRFMRHYWTLSNCGGLFVESASQAGPCSMYMANDSHLLIAHQNEVNEVMQSLLDQVELECDCNSANSVDIVFVANSQHLIERFSADDPFKFTLKFDHPDVLNLTFKQIELLVKDQIQHKQPMSVADIYLNKNTSLNTASCWWFCDNIDEWKQLRDCLSLRGYRERALAKVVSKLGEGENTNEFAVSNQSLTQSFEKGNQFLKEFLANQQSLKEEQEEESDDSLSDKRTASNRTNPIEQREKNKLLKQLYSLEDKVFNANLHSSPFNHTDDDKEDAINVVKKRLLDLEKRIERRYLKYPFACKKDYSNFNFEPKFDGPKEKLIEAIKKNTIKVKLNEKCAYDLEVWRRLVQNATSCSQLAILTIELNKHIAWNKSIMKVICQICNCDDNEDKLLLCDYCDCGFHTYCFKPTLKTIPEGDWYCYICISKFLNDESICCVCGSTKNPTDLHKCNKCKKLFHSECMPNAKCFKTTSKWHCLNCHNSKPKAIGKQQQQADQSGENGKKRKIKEQPAAQNQTKVNLKKSKMSNKDSLESQEDENEMDTETESEPAKKKGKKLKEDVETAEETSPVVNKKNNRSLTNSKKGQIELNKKTSTSTTNKNVNNQEVSVNQKSNSTKTVFLDRDFQKCRNLFNEMCRNEHAWPFQEKVDEKDYPDYYDLIKEPMDLQTIRNKLKNKEYETKEQFAYDCRLIFDNCEFFNEDESDVGQAGYKLRAFFETKWMKLFD